MFKVILVGIAKKSDKVLKEVDGLGHAKEVAARLSRRQDGMPVDVFDNNDNRICGYSQGSLYYW